MLEINYNDLDTGDLIFFRSKKYHKIMSFLYNIGLTEFEYTHVGIILKKNNKLYICESNKKLKSGERGCAIVEFCNRIRNYKGDHFIYTCRKKLSDIQKEYIINTCINAIGYPYFLRHCYTNVEYILNKFTYKFFGFDGNTLGNMFNLGFY